MTKQELIYDKIAGALYGVAVGDALGAPVEFMTAEQIKQKHGYVTEMLGGGFFNLSVGETTDDTAMTFAVADGIIENPNNPTPAVGMQFIKWLSCAPKDVGITCQIAIRQAMILNSQQPLKSSDWDNVSEKTHFLLKGKTAGNGSLMRTVYPGLYYTNINDAEKIAQHISLMTHFDSSASEACVLYTNIIFNIIKRAITGKEVDKTVFDILNNTVYAVDDNPLLCHYPLPPSGYVVNSFLCALASIISNDTFEDTLCYAVNLGGDADTIAAIAGGIAGAYYGYSAIPKRWIDALSIKDKEHLDYLANVALKNKLTSVD